eukprot:8191772-Pyramimonas_sp.AAC.1
MQQFGLSQVWFKPFRVIPNISASIHLRMSFNVLGWIQVWDALDDSANEKYNAVALMRWKQIFKLAFLAIA